MVLRAELDETDEGSCKVCSNMHSYELICNYLLYLQFEGNT